MSKRRAKHPHHQMIGIPKNGKEWILPPATIPITGADAVYSWVSQVTQYPERGPYGISYFAGPTKWGDVDCLLFRNIIGELVGILNHYPFSSPFEELGNVNVWVSPAALRQGIATQLLAEADRRWSIDFSKQRYTVQGRALVQAYLERKS